MTSVMTVLLLPVSPRVLDSVGTRISNCWMVLLVSSSEQLHTTAESLAVNAYGVDDLRRSKKATSPALRFTFGRGGRWSGRDRTLDS